MNIFGINRVKDPTVSAQQDPQHAKNRLIQMAISGMSGLTTDPRVYAANQLHALEMWPEKLMNLSIPSTGISLSCEERDELIAWCGELNWNGEFLIHPSSKWDEASDADFFKEMERKTHKSWIDTRQTFNEIYSQKGKLSNSVIISQVVTKVNNLLEKFPFEQPFFKLGSRSPKDSPFFALCNGRISSGEEAVLLMLTSTRMLEDFMSSQFQENYKKQIAKQSRDMTIEEFGKLIGVHDLILAERIRTENENDIKQTSLPWIWLREYQYIPQYTEFRCFMRKGEFVGGTQYHGIIQRPIDLQPLKIEAFPELIERGPEYEKLINEWFPIFRDACPYDDAVFDIKVDIDKQHITLIETNPALKGTFPGLKNWKTLQSEHEDRKKQGLPGADIAWAIENYDIFEDSHKPIVITPLEIQQLRQSEILRNNILIKRENNNLLR